MGVKEPKEFNVDVIDQIQRGESFQWDKAPKV
jgi:hypothetical protein